MTAPGKTCRRLILLALAGAVLNSAQGAETAPWSRLPDTVEDLRPAVAAVGTYNPAHRPPMEFGASGFFINDRGYFLTANHAIEAIEKQKRLAHLRVFMPSYKNRRGIPATVVGRDPRHDFALLKVKGDAYPAAEIGDSKTVRAGQPIALMGFPLGFLRGLHPSTNAGIISNVSPIAIPAVNTKQLDAETIDALRNPFDVFQLDATAYPGNSGGPLFDPRSGKVLGMVNRAFVRKTRERVVTSGISYAVPIHHAAPLIKHALKASTKDAP